LSHLKQFLWDYSREDLEKTDDSGNLTLRRAYVFDVGEILALINNYASSNLMLPRGPKYLYENIRDFVVVEVVGERAEPKIVACGSLHVLWKDIAEIRALATHPRCQNRGLGSKIVRYLIEEARRIGIEKVFAFTLEKEFLRSLVSSQRQKRNFHLRCWVNTCNARNIFSVMRPGSASIAPNSLNS